MGPAMALQGLLPLIVFAVVDIFASMRTALIAAIVFALIEAGWSYYSFGEVDQLTWISLGLVVVMGVVSIRMNNDRLFKFQPVALAVISALFLAYFQWRGEPLMVQMMPKVIPLLPEDKRAFATDPRMLAMVGRLDLILIFAFLIHAAWVAWAAINKSTMYWLVARGVGFYALLAMAMLLNSLLGLP